MHGAEFHGHVLGPFIVADPQDAFPRVAVVLVRVLKEGEHRIAVLVYSQSYGGGELVPRVVFFLAALASGKECGGKRQSGEQFKR